MNSHIFRPNVSLYKNKKDFTYKKVSIFLNTHIFSCSTRPYHASGIGALQQKGRCFGDKL